MSSCTLCTDRNLHRVCTSVACRVDRPCIHAAATRGSTLPPWSPASFPEPPSSAHTQDIPDIMTGCRQRRFLAEIVTGSHGSHATARVCHRRRPSRRHPAAARYAHGFCVDYLRQMQRTGRPVGPTWPAGPPCDNVTCKHLDTLYHAKTDGSEGSFAHTCYTYIIASVIFLHGCPSLASCTSLQ